MSTVQHASIELHHVPSESDLEGFIADAAEKLGLTGTHIGVVRSFKGSLTCEAFTSQELRGHLGDVRVTVTAFGPARDAS